MAHKCKHLGKTYGKPYCKSTSIILKPEEVKTCTPELCNNFEFREAKFKAKRCWSELCQRTFDSKLERERGEQLCLLEKGGEIFDLEYQVPFYLSKNKKFKIVVDFKYRTKKYDGPSTFYLVDVWEDAKGKLTEASNVRYAWAKEKGIEVQLWPPR